MSYSDSESDYPPSNGLKTSQQITKPKPLQVTKQSQFKAEPGKPQQEQAKNFTSGIQPAQI